MMTTVRCIWRYTLTLNITGTVTLNGANNGDGAAFRANSGDVTINGFGTLHAVGGDYSLSAHGIVVYNDTVTVQSSCTIYATGGFRAAGGGTGIVADTLDNSGTIYAQGGYGNGYLSPASGGDGIDGSVINRSGGSITAIGGDTGDGAINSMPGSNGINAGGAKTVTNESGGTIIAMGGKGSKTGSAGGIGISTYSGDITNSGTIIATGGAGGDNGGTGGDGVFTYNGDIINQSGGTITATGGQGGSGSGTGGIGASALGDIINNANPADFIAIGGRGGSPSGTNGKPTNKGMGMVIVNNSYAGARNDGTGFYNTGDTVTINAGTRSGYTFNGWAINSGGISLASESSETTTFTMPANDVEVTAKWASNSGDTSGPAITYQTLTHPGTGITAKGYFGAGAKLTITKSALHAASTCPACDEIRAQQAAGNVLALYDISVSGGYSGSLEVSIPVASKHKGKSLKVLHCHSKTLEHQTIIAQNGYVTGTWSGLLPFAVLTPNNNAGVPKTGDASNMGMWAVMLVALFGFAWLAARQLARKRGDARR